MERGHKQPLRHESVQERLRKPLHGIHPSGGFPPDYETGYLQSALDTLALAEELIESLRVSVAEYDRIGANKLGRGVSALYLVERHLSGFLERAESALRDFEFGYSPSAAGRVEGSVL